MPVQPEMVSEFTLTRPGASPFPYTSSPLRSWSAREFGCPASTGGTTRCSSYVPSATDTTYSCRRTSGTAFSAARIVSDSFGTTSTRLSVLTSGRSPSVVSEGATVSPFASESAVSTRSAATDSASTVPAATDSGARVAPPAPALEWSRSGGGCSVSVGGSVVSERVALAVPESVPVSVGDSTDSRLPHPANPSAAPTVVGTPLHLMSSSTPGRNGTRHHRTAARSGRRAATSGLRRSGTRRPAAGGVRGASR